jgi:hypothetical protein
MSLQSAATEKLPRWFFIAWLAYVGMAGTAYCTGLGATFLFDDVPNLEGLQALQRPHADVNDLVLYVASGVAGGVGRPLALLSFAAQKSSWPNHPEEFLAANVFIHLLNSALLLICLLRALRLSGLTESRATAVALLTSGLWAAAPIHIGAVLYVIQRMALLAAFFGLLGLLVYLVGRERLDCGKSRSGVALMVLGMGISTGLGSLAKETAVLVPLLVLVLEMTLFKPPARTAAWRLGCWIALIAPLIAILLHTATHLTDFLTGYERREFNLPERLLTEGRVLLLYVQKILLPPLYSMRMYYDDFVISTSILQPLSTLLCVILWACLGLSALYLRRRRPFFAFAILWFLAAHLLESTIFPLEIAFDHRNYLAAIGPLLLIAAAALSAFHHLKAKTTRILTAAALMLYAGYSLAACWQSAALRGQPLQQASYWKYSQPESRRAGMDYAILLARLGLTENAEGVFQDMHRKWPGEPSVMTIWYELACEVEQLNGPGLDEVIATLQNPAPDFLIVAANVSGIVDLARSGKCAKHSPEEIERLARAVAFSPNAVPMLLYLNSTYAYAAYAAGKRDLATRYLEEAIRLNPQLGLIKQRIYWALETGDISTARAYVEVAESSTSTNSMKRWAFQKDISGLKHLIGIAEDFQKRMEIYGE